MHHNPWLAGSWNTFQLALTAKIAGVSSYAMQLCHASVQFAEGRASCCKLRASGERTPADPQRGTCLCGGVLRGQHLEQVGNEDLQSQQNENTAVPCMTGK